jgi:chromosome segregation ATPase
MCRGRIAPGNSVALLKIINGVLPGISTGKKCTKVEKWKKPHKLRVAATGKLRHCSRTMKGNYTTILAVVALIAGAWMMIQLSKSNTTISEQGDTITQNEKEIKELKTDKATLETTQADLTKKLNTANSTVSETQDALSKLETNYGQKVAEYETFVTKAAQELAAKDEKISALNGELQTAQNKNRDYDSQIKTLNNQMADKNREIDDIGRRLKSTEEDRDHLLLEQKKLIAEKAELEKQFQDILVLRKKVQQLQVELMASKKLEWLRRGFYGGARKKGGSQLMSMSKKNDRKTVSTNADLNVEVRRDGTVKIVPIETNSPPNGATP